MVLADSRWLDERTRSWVSSASYAAPRSRLQGFSERPGFCSHKSGQVLMEKDKQWIVIVADEKLAVWKLELLKGQKKKTKKQI